MRPALRHTQYRHRRHRAATARRGTEGCRRPRGGTAQRGFLRSIGPDAAPALVALHGALGDLGQRVRNCPGIAGALYATQAGQVSVFVVAAKPVQRLVFALLRSWVADARVRCPHWSWSARVGARAPLRAETYGCLFWRPPG